MDVLAMKICGMRVMDIAGRLGVSHQCVSALLKKGRVRLKL